MYTIMLFKVKTAIVAGTSVLFILAISILSAPTANAFIISPDGGTIAASIPCVSPMGMGFWTIKTNSATPVVYLYPGYGMRSNYLPPTTGITTLGLVGPLTPCVTTTFPPITLSGRISIMYGTGLGF